ncbi:MAG TPA: hypothetical protein DCM02_13440 [Flavobacterium sp.]|nr:hypothetical protein [Flavobacterium sp.]
MILNRFSQLAQTAVESLEGKKTIFSCPKRATKGSSFLGLEKKFFERKLERMAGIAPKNN